ncbi:MAG: lysylphosphatidylglycerol synthase domain-containing protein, partial [Polyangiales bacterium]
MRPTEHFRKKQILMVAGFVCSGLALYYFLRRVDGDQLRSALVSANLWVLSIGMLTKLAVLSLNAVRTQILLLPLRRYTFSECFFPWLSGFVMDNLFPFRLGELVRIDLLARAGRI